MGLRQQRAVADGYAATTAELRSTLVTALIALWRSLGSWRTSDQPRWLSIVVPQVLGAQRQMASLTDVCLAAVIGDMTGRPGRPRGIIAATGKDLRGVPPEEEYGRPFHDLYAALGEARSLDQALDAASHRIATLVATDLQLAKTHAAREILTSTPEVQGYQRVLRGPHSCALCMIASTQRYHRENLMPIHPGCDCDVIPIVGHQDPGQVINAGRVEDVHAAIQEQFGISDRGGRAIGYRDLLVTHQHGEIGPILARRGDRFTGPDDLQNAPS